MVHRSKVKKTMELVQIYFKNVNKLTIITSTVSTNFLAFFCYYFKIFPHGSGSRRENEYGSMRIWIHSLAFTVFKKEPSTKNLVYLSDSNQLKMVQICHPSGAGMQKR